MKLPLQQIVMSIVIGVIPSSVLYAYGGEALFHGYNKTAVTLVASVTVLVGLVVFIYKDRQRKTRKTKTKIISMANSCIFLFPIFSISCKLR